jgi:flavin reductase (DIM6/NTAB) family NADH-FMN oxidoreductase RutF
MIDSRQFLNTIGLFASGVTVITTERDGQIHGMTANAVTSLSLDPMLVIVCLGKKAKISERIQIGGNLTINILRDEQEAISNHFAGGWQQKQVPEFTFAKWDGGVRLEGILAAIGCHIQQMLDGGDHWIILCHVIALHQGVEPRQPLLYFGSKYRRLDPGIASVAPERLDLAEGEPQIFYDPW